MAEWEHALNAYEVLGLAQGFKATDAEIGKVGNFCRHPMPPIDCVTKKYTACAGRHSCVASGSATVMRHGTVTLRQGDRTHD